MIRHRSAAALAAVACFATTPPRWASADDETIDYVVRAGDTCYAIAARELGDRSRLDVLHRLNPQLGPLPHHLRPGQVLKLPRVTVLPDARLTAAAGLVRFRKPAQRVWDAARRGMELFRAWRVGAEERSSAEVTFRDDDRLQLRENTIVIIYGPERAGATVTPAQAVLEQGTLRSRLGELSPTVRVTTPTAIATLGRGSALVAVAPGGELSTVANHDGAAVPVKGRAGGTVKVAAGMGSRVARGRRPEKPRPLPAAPAWAAPMYRRFAAVDGRPAIVSAAWTPVPAAARYRVEVLTASGTVVGAAEVPASVTRFELMRVPPGEYQARVSSIDGRRLEGKPGPMLAIAVVPVSVRPPGDDGSAVTTAAAATAAATAATTGDADAPLELGGPAPPAPLAARGASFGGAGAAVPCAIGGATPGIAWLMTLGPVEVRCTAGGEAIAPFTVLVVGITAAVRGGAPAIALAAGAPQTVTVELASPAPLGRRWRVDAPPGVLVLGTEVDGGALVLSLRAEPRAAARSQLAIVDGAGGPPLATVPVTVTVEGGGGGARP